MQFFVIPTDSSVPAAGVNVGYLWADGWNDWWKYRTLYVLTVFDSDGQKHDVGGVKIGQFGWSEDQGRPELPAVFETLDERFFSLGQDVSYYSKVAQLGTSLAGTILTALRDVSADSTLYDRALPEDVMSNSLMRSVSPVTVSGQFRRVLGGGAALTEFTFSYVSPSASETSEGGLAFGFKVTPESKPPTNIHVLIGRNGVGKSYLLNGMTRALVSQDDNAASNGLFKGETDWIGYSSQHPFASLVSVTFSAFDEFQPVHNAAPARHGFRYANVGLRRETQDRDGKPVMVTLDPGELAHVFAASAKSCIVGERLNRWRQALTTLEADPIFQAAQVSDLANAAEDHFVLLATTMFRKFSSGHKIVLLTITKLVEKVEEKTLVLMDEPEAHLHPPLLSAFVRAVSDLLVNRNGVSIIATHSPVVIQEVPASCVWKIVRHGREVRADRPEVETFGENIGVLTREIFGLEVTRSGFHKMLAEASRDAESLGDVLHKFDNEVGSEGRALIASLIAARKARGGSN